MGLVWISRSRKSFHTNPTGLSPLIKMCMNWILLVPKASHPPLFCTCCCCCPSSSSAKVLRYKGLELCKAVPAGMVAGTVRRVLQGWMAAHPCHKRNHSVKSTLSKVKATFRPTADVSVLAMKRGDHVSIRSIGADAWEVVRCLPPP